MKQEKYYCDRCGEEVKHGGDWGFMHTSQTTPFLLKWDEPVAKAYTPDVCLEDIRRQMTEEGQKFADGYAIEVKVKVETWFSEKYRTYELCPKCMKRLRLFMKGDI